MLAHRAEALDHHPGLFQLEIAEIAAILQGHLRGMTEAPAGGADFVQGNAADFRWQPTTRPISSLIQAMHSSSVPMSGAKMYSCTPAGSRPGPGSGAPCRFGHVGVAHSTTLPPPWGKPAAAFFRVMARASRKHSSVVTSGPCAPRPWPARRPHCPPPAPPAG
jgi:hypothetical protein